MTETQTQETLVTAGEMLKQLREEKQLTIQAVASQMHLEPRVIELLEANDFDSLPAATYVRGYLRSYAKLLAADTDKIISLYNNNAPEPPEIIPEVKHPTQTSSSDKPVKAFTYLISFILALLLIAWWQSHYLIGTDFMTGQEMKTDQRPPGLSYTYPIIKHPESPFYRSPDNTTDVQADMVDSTTVSKSVTELLEVDSMQQGEMDLIDERGSGPDKVVMKLQADSWVEVFESDGNKLYLNLARAGQTLILKGTAPFSVLLGFSQGVLLEFNGKPFDPAPYSRAGIAKFTLENKEQ